VFDHVRSPILFLRLDFSIIIVSRKPRFYCVPFQSLHSLLPHVSQSRSVNRCSMRNRTLNLIQSIDRMDMIRSIHRGNTRRDRTNFCRSNPCPPSRRVILHKKFYSVIIDARIHICYTPQKPDVEFPRPAFYSIQFRQNWSH
jgi:hypothetical protein